MYTVSASNTFKIYKHNGRPSIVVRASFPRINGEGDEATRFNSFYARLESECADSVARLTEHAEWCADNGGGYSLIEVSFNAECNENGIKITRKYETKRNSKVVTSTVLCDSFSSDLFLRKIKKHYKTKKNSVTERKKCN